MSVPFFVVPLRPKYKFEYKFMTRKDQILTMEEHKVKVRIRNSGEDDATIVREMTKEEYEFLSDIAQDLNCEGEEFSPILFVDILENE